MREDGDERALTFPTVEFTANLGIIDGYSSEW